MKQIYLEDSKGKELFISKVCRFFKAPLKWVIGADDVHIKMSADGKKGQKQQSKSIRHGGFLNPSDRGVETGGMAVSIGLLPIIIPFSIIAGLISLLSPAHRKMSIEVGKKAFDKIQENGINYLQHNKEDGSTEKFLMLEDPSTKKDPGFLNSHDHYINNDHKERYIVFPNQKNGTPIHVSWDAKTGIPVNTLLNPKTNLWHPLSSLNNHDPLTLIQDLKEAPKTKTIQLSLQRENKKGDSPKKELYYISGYGQEPVIIEQRQDDSWAFLYALGDSGWKTIDPKADASISEDALEVMGLNFRVALNPSIQYAPHTDSSRLNTPEIQNILKAAEKEISAVLQAKLK